MDSRLHIETVENGVADDVLYLIHLINRIENIVSRTPLVIPSHLPPIAW